MIEGFAMALMALICAGLVAIATGVFALLFGWIGALAIIGGSAAVASVIVWGASK